MIYITGDCHAKWARKFAVASFPEQKSMTRDDFVIVCGDFGIWHDTKEERWWLNWLAEKSFTVCFVDGNHENFNRLYSDEFEVVDFHGGKAHKIRDNIYHLMRGYVFDICDKKIFAFGGASSHDIDDGILDPDEFPTKKAYKTVYKHWANENKSFRIKNVSWWEQEIPSQKEMIFGFKTLEENNYKVDFIISHCLPQEIASIFSCGCYKPDELTEYFDKVKDIVDFKNWFCGHYHFDEMILNKYIILYDQIIRIA